MKKYKYSEFDQNGDYEIIVSEDDIMKIYFPTWREKMLKVGKSHLINKQNCIEDFCTVNWACEIKEEK